VFYCSRSVACTSGPKPMVTCIMPTADRRRHIPQAIRCYLAQDYPNRELLILDDGTDRIEDLVPDRPDVRYVGLDAPLVLGAKRNLACRLAVGDMICHWDDDDWSASDRVSSAVAAMDRMDLEVCGSRSLLYFSPSENRAWRYAYPAEAFKWVAGNTLCYRREAWMRSNFPEIRVGEDSAFTRSHRPGRVGFLEGNGVIGIIHERNTSPKRVDGLYWRSHPVEEVHRILGAALSFYLEFST
jgi:glycosyltransferase involved in cell wall biosynthesis